MLKSGYGHISESVEKNYRDLVQREIIEGCQGMAEVYGELENDFHPLEEEAQRILDQWTET